MTRVRRIVCASDFSSASRKAVATAVTMAKANRAALILVHVVAPIVRLAPDQYVPSTTWEEIEIGARAWAQEQIDKLAARAMKAGIRAAGLLVEGEAAKEIVRVARSKRADLLVLGTHGRTGVSKFFLGSVAERVVATASCPVVTVRGR
jgi:nucleotide-binding universal stress UspA family protein